MASNEPIIDAVLQEDDNFSCDSFVLHRINTSKDVDAFLRYTNKGQPRSLSSNLKNETGKKTGEFTKHSNNNGNDNDIFFQDSYSISKETSEDHPLQHCLQPNIVAIHGKTTSKILLTSSANTAIARFPPTAISIMILVSG